MQQQHLLNNHFRRKVLSELLCALPNHSRMVHMDLAFEGNDIVLGFMCNIEL